MTGDAPQLWDGFIRIAVPRGPHNLLYAKIKNANSYVKNACVAHLSVVTVQQPLLYM